MRDGDEAGACAGEGVLVKRIFHVRPAFDCSAGACSDPKCTQGTHGWGTEAWWIGVGDGLVGMSINVYTPFCLPNRKAEEFTRSGILTSHFGFRRSDTCLSALLTEELGEACELVDSGLCYDSRSTGLGAETWWKEHGVEPVQGGQPDEKIWRALARDAEKLRERALPTRVDDPATPVGRAFMELTESAKKFERFRS